MSEGNLMWTVADEEFGAGWSRLPDDDLGVPVVGDVAVDADVERLFQDSSNSDSGSDFSLDEMSTADPVTEDSAGVAGDTEDIYGGAENVGAESPDSSPAGQATEGTEGEETEEQQAGEQVGEEGTEQEEGASSGAEEEGADYVLRPQLLIDRLRAGTLTDRDKAAIEQLLTLVEHHGLPGTATSTGAEDGDDDDDDWPADKSSTTTIAATNTITAVAATAALPEVVRPSTAAPAAAVAASSTSSTPRQKKGKKGDGGSGSGSGTPATKRGRQWTEEEDELGKATLWPLTAAGDFTEARFARVAAVLRAHGFDRDATSVRNRARRAWRYQDGRDDRRPRTDGRPRELITSARKEKKAEMMEARRRKEEEEDVAEEEEGRDDSGEELVPAKGKRMRDDAEPEAPETSPSPKRRRLAR